MPPLLAEFPRVPSPEFPSASRFLNPMDESLNKPDSPRRPSPPRPGERSGKPQGVKPKRVEERLAVPAPHLKPAATVDRAHYARSLRDHLLSNADRWSERAQWQHAIGLWVLQRSETMDGRNFCRVACQDLERMAEAYDQTFFGGWCLPLARTSGLSFRLSSRMTRAGGKTTRQTLAAPPGKPSITRYEIAVSTNLLFQSFRRRGDRTRVCGIDCCDRLSAMQRVLEHELIHLCEMLVWIHSDCSAARFQSMAHRLFLHTEHRHELVTPQERAAKEFAIRPGSRVAFEVRGKVLSGIVNRITTRATILVPDPSGPRYNDGRCYAKYYVPIHRVRRLD